MPIESHQITSYLNKCGVNTYSPKIDDNSFEFSINVWAKPGSKMEKVTAGQNGELIVCIKQRPIEGKANKAITKFLGKRFGISPSLLILDGGGKSRMKRFKVIYTFTDHKNLSYYLEKLTKLFL